MMPIGGFLPLETGDLGRPGWHPSAAAYSTGRACMYAFLRGVRPSRVYIPFYCCDALFEPLQSLGIRYDFYGLDHALEPQAIPDRLESDTWLVYTNFFGVKNDFVAELLERYPGRVLVDDTHRFFHQGYPDTWSFTSARKYFGVPDGAYLYGPSLAPSDFPRFLPSSVHHLTAVYTSRAAEAHAAFRAAEDALGGEFRMSLLSERILGAIDYEAVRDTRRHNRAYLAAQLQRWNTLTVADDADESFCYPFLPERAIPVQAFHERGFFLPRYWLDTHGRADPGYTWERRLSAELLNIPVDHRYTPDDLGRIVEFIHNSVR